MIRSMTGFARAEITTPQGQLLWEVRSINHRYLEVQLKLPDFCRPLETDLRQLATTQLGRGRVEATLSLRAGEGRAPAGRLNLVLIRQLAVYLHGLAGDLAEADEGEVSMTSADLAAHIGDAVLDLSARRKVVEKS